MSKNVNVHRSTHYLLRRMQGDERSIDMVVNRLLNTVESDLKDSESLVGHINIELEEDTLRRIKELGVSDKEPYDSVLRRALLLYLRFI